MFTSPTHYLQRCNQWFEDPHGKLNPLLPWQKQHWTTRRHFPQQTALKCKEWISEVLHFWAVGRNNSVDIATGYGLDGPGIEWRWGRDFPPVQTGPRAHPAFCKMGTGSFPGVKFGRGVLLTTHPLLMPRSWKSRAIPLPTLWATPGL